MRTKGLRFGLVALVLTLVVGMFGYAVSTSYAQRGDGNDDCWKKKSRYVTRTNPFTGQEVTVLDEYWDYNDACNVIQDDRVNRLDAAAGAAIYCNDSGIVVYDLDMSGNGTLAFIATWDEIGAIPATPAENTLIEGIPGIVLYRLTTGEMQLNAVVDAYPPRQYYYTWEGCSKPTVGE